MKEFFLGLLIFRSFYGQNEFHRNVLSVKNQPPGEYRLTVYEAAPNTDAKLVGCSHFTFNLFIDKTKPSASRRSGSTSSSSVYSSTLPHNLDSVAYLKYSDYLHLAGKTYHIQKKQKKKAKINVLLFF